MSADQRKEDIFHLTLKETGRIRNLSEHVSEWSDYIAYKKTLWEKERDDVFPCEFLRLLSKACHASIPTGRQWSGGNRSGPQQRKCCRNCQSH